jgi:hypothetical protein
VYPKEVMFSTERLVWKVMLEVKKGFRGLSTVTGLSLGVAYCPVELAVPVNMASS